MNKCNGSIGDGGGQIGKQSMSQSFHKLILVGFDFIYLGVYIRIHIC
jgi:hypothetical protein